MNTIHFPKKNVIFFVLVMILTSLLAVACGGPGPTAPSSEQPTQTSLAPEATAATAQEEATLPPIPTAASVRIPTMMILISTPTADAGASPSTQVSCTAPAGLTPEATEGPYFKAGSPETADLYQAGMTGTKLTLTGYVLTADCQPVAHALVDFWQADSNGVYDNNGYTLRGHQFTDATGRYQVVTVIPGLYTGRTEHIHVKVQAGSGPVLTTQLFFPDVPSNQTDSIFNASLVMSIQENADVAQGQFNFIIKP